MINFLLWWYEQYLYFVYSTHHNAYRNLLFKIIHLCRRTVSLGKPTSSICFSLPNHSLSAWQQTDQRYHVNRDVSYQEVHNNKPRILIQYMLALVFIYEGYKGKQFACSFQPDFASITVWFEIKIWIYCLISYLHIAQLFYLEVLFYLGLLTQSVIMCTRATMYTGVYHKRSVMVMYRVM